MSCNRRTKDLKYDPFKFPLPLSKFQIAVGKGDFKAVRAAIRRGADPNQPISGTDTTPIHIAIYMENARMAKELITAGVDINLKNANKTPLVIAVSCGKVEMVKVLLANGADINVRVEQYDSVLHVAALEGKLDIVELLIDSGLDVNARNYLDETPLHAAVKGGKAEVVRLLLRKGADVNGVCCYKFDDVETVQMGSNITAKFIAILLGHLEIVDILIKAGANLDARTSDGCTALHCAVLKRHRKFLKLLLKAGADVNARSHYGETPLFLAARDGYPDIVADLLKVEGINLNIPDDDQNTPLFIAAASGHLEIVKLLIAKVAPMKETKQVPDKPYESIAPLETALLREVDANAQSNDGKTPLFCAVQEGYTEIVAELLKVEGIDLNIPNDDQQTPLFVAAESGHLEIVKLLVAKGAPINDTIPTPDEPNSSIAPLDIALLGGKEDVAEFLIQSGADIHATRNLTDGMSVMAFACSVQAFSPKLGKLLIEKGGDVNERSKDGMSLLHLAAQADNDPLETVQFLVEHGADADVQDNEKWAPLHEAAGAGNVKIVEYLATKVKQIDPVTISSETPLQSAVENGHLKIVEILLDHGANPNVQNSKKRTPLHVAVGAKQSEIVKLLLKKKAVVNLKDNEGEHTPLFLATKNKDEKLVNLLLQYDADPNIGNKFGIMPIHVASKEGDVNVVKALLEKGAYFNVKGGTKIFKGPPLMFAKKGGNAKIITLLELIEDFFKAVVQNNTQQIKCYVQAGAIVNARNASGRTALHYAVGNENVDALKTLLVNGADVGFSSNIGNTPLHIAVTNQSMNIVEILLTHAKQLNFLKFNSLINAKITEGDATVLHFAAESNCLNIVKLLLKNGAIYNNKNKSGKISSQLTASEEIKILLNSVEKLFKAVEKDDSEEVLQILENNESVVNARDLNGGGTPLYWAVSKGYKDLANLLLANNADYFLVTNKGTTPLHMAVSKGNLEMVRTLVTRVKNDHAKRVSDFLDAQTVSGTTALHVASSVNVVKCLLQAGATYNIRNREDKTPLETTANSDIQKLLKLTQKLFKDVEKGSSAVVSTVNSLKVEESRAVLNAQNEQGKTLVDVAVANGHVKIAGKLLEKSKKLS